MHNQTAHSLNSIDFYTVYKTYSSGEKLVERDFAKRFTSYIAAQEFKRSLISTRGEMIFSWAIVTATYSDGCESEAF